VTERLAAEWPDPGLHLEFLAGHYADERIARWHWPVRPDGSGGPRTVAQTFEMLEQRATAAGRDGFAVWLWRELATGQLVGEVGLARVEIERVAEVEVGWSITPERWREGLALEAARASLAWGFSRAELERIVSYTLPGNKPSRALMERLGLTYEREFERDGNSQVLYAASRDTRATG
jgi:RimJ/RimL family protein N-acetyltransferase